MPPTIFPNGRRSEDRCSLMGIRRKNGGRNAAPPASWRRRAACLTEKTLHQLSRHYPRLQNLLWRSYRYRGPPLPSWQPRPGRCGRPPAPSLPSGIPGNPPLARCAPFCRLSSAGGFCALRAGYNFAHAGGRERGVRKSTQPRRGGEALLAGRPQGRGRQGAQDPLLLLRRSGRGSGRRRPALPWMREARPGIESLVGLRFPLPRPRIWVSLQC